MVSTTVTVKEQVPMLPDASSAVKVTTVSPIGKKPSGAWLKPVIIAVVSQLSVTVGESVNNGVTGWCPHDVVPSSLTSSAPTTGQAIVGGCQANNENTHKMRKATTYCFRSNPDRGNPGRDVDVATDSKQRERLRQGQG